jgi:hypothetical protein
MSVNITFSPPLVTSAIQFHKSEKPLRRNFEGRLIEIIKGSEPYTESTACKVGRITFASIGIFISYATLIPSALTANSFNLFPGAGLISSAAVVINFGTFGAANYLELSNILFKPSKDDGKKCMSDGVLYESTKSFADMSSPLGISFFAGNFFATFFLIYLVMQNIAERGIFALAKSKFSHPEARTGANILKKFEEIEEAVQSASLESLHDCMQAMRLRNDLTPDQMRILSHDAKTNSPAVKSSNLTNEKVPLII